MGKLCWKCHQWVPDDSSVCPYCGAEFASKGDKLQPQVIRNNGANDYRGLNPGPDPRGAGVRLSKKKVAFTLIIAIAVLAIGCILLSNTNSEEIPSANADVTYNTNFIYPSLNEVVVYVTYKNIHYVSLDIHNAFTVTMEWNGYGYDPSETKYLTPNVISQGNVCYAKYTFKLPSEGDHTIVFTHSTSMDFEKDSRLYVPSSDTDF